MIRTTIQECINLFHSNVTMQRAAIRGMEQLGEWGVAAQYWAKLGDIENEKACRLIQESIDKGDCYRDSVKHLSEWVDETVEQGIMTKEKAIQVVYSDLQKIYKQFYN